jgi:hypothetical protein
MTGGSWRSDVISSVDGLARQRVSDEEYEACLAALYASRRAGLG